VDLICANYVGNSLTVLTNNGSGTFGSNATYTVGSEPISVVAADVNADGKVDLICANYNDSTLTVLTNDGHGGFVLSSTIHIGSYPASVVAADVNADEKSDLVTANSGGNNLTVLTNDGSGNFAIASSPDVGRGPFCVAAADVNGDGKVDLISANLADTTLTVLTNDGSGGFVFSGTYAVVAGSFNSGATTPGWVTAADINGEGQVDLISANGDFVGSGTTLTVLTNDWSGGFISNATYTVGTGPFCVVAADVNGDGKVDLISAGTQSSTLTVLTNNGIGGFVSAISPGVGNGSYSVVAGDVNGNGKLDLICANFNNSTLTVLTNTSIFPPPSSTPPLNINFQSNGLQVSWPSPSAGWSLQQNRDLATTNWGPSGYSGCVITDDRTNKCLTMPHPPGNLFFRLLHP
jgi:hypothetical protein